MYEDELDSGALQPDLADYVPQYAQTNAVWPFTGASSGALQATHCSGHFTLWAAAPLSTTSPLPRSPSIA